MSHTIGGNGIWIRGQVFLYSGMTEWFNTPGSLSRSKQHLWQALPRILPVFCKKGKKVVLQRRRRWHPTPVLFPGKSHGWRSLVGCSPRGREESGMTERLPFHFSLSCIGEGNGNPLQCSCLENPRDGGAWRAAIYGVTQSQTRLKQLSSLAASFTDEETEAQRT